MTMAQMVDTLALPEDTRLMVLAPVVARKGEQAGLLEVRAQGFMRVRIDGPVYEIRRGAEARTSSTRSTSSSID